MIIRSSWIFIYRAHNWRSTNAGVVRPADQRLFIRCGRNQFLLEISVGLALVRDSDCAVCAANVHGSGGGGLGSNQTVAGLKLWDVFSQ